MILQFLPLDEYVDFPTTLMAVLPGDPYQPTIWKEYQEIALRHEKNGLGEKAVHKSEFYEKGKNCFVCIATGEQALYGNIILKKGVVK